MSDNPDLDRYLQRDATVFGRIINNVIDTARQAIGKPGLWLQAAEHDIEQIKAREQQTQLEATITNSGLSVSNQQGLRDIAKAFPGLESAQFEALIDLAREQHTQQQQLELLSTSMLLDLPHKGQATERDRLIEIAQEGLYDNLHEHDQYALFDLVETHINELEPSYSLELTQRERDFQTLSLADWNIKYSDLGQDYTEAWADVANDATLAHRLENEDPRDILNDIKQQARRDIGIDQGLQHGRDTGR